MQIERTSSVDFELQTVQKKMPELSTTRLEKINAQLTTAKMKALKVPTEEEWRKGDDKNQSSGTHEQLKVFLSY
jgi:hypothetical protein